MTFVAQELFVIIAGIIEYVVFTAFFSIGIAIALRSFIIAAETGERE